MFTEVLLENEFGHIRKEIFSDPSSSTTTHGLSIVHKLCHAKISLYGGHVTSWQPINQKPVFWMSDTSLFGNGKGIRGGVPICFPWFGPFDEKAFKHTNNNLLSEAEKKQCVNHGFARTSTWKIDSIDVEESHVKIILNFSGEDKSPAWKIPFELKQEIILGEAFSQRLLITNKSDQPIEYTGALHSYFSVSSPVNTNINQLSGVSFDDKITNEKNVLKVLSDCEGPLDRIYYSNQTINIIDTIWKRKITVEAEGAYQWVLWNPGKKIAENMSDVHTNGENEYVCLEAANTQPVLIDAGTTVILGQSITLDIL